MQTGTSLGMHDMWHDNNNSGTHGLMEAAHALPLPGSTGFCVWQMQRQDRRDAGWVQHYVAAVCECSGIGLVACARVLDGVSGVPAGCISCLLRHSVALRLLRVSFDVRGAPCTAKCWRAGAWMAVCATRMSDHTPHTALALTALSDRVPHHPGARM